MGLSDRKKRPSFRNGKTGGEKTAHCFVGSKTEEKSRNFTCKTSSWSQRISGRSAPTSSGGHRKKRSRRGGEGDSSAVLQKKGEREIRMGKTALILSRSFLAILKTKKKKDRKKEQSRRMKIYRFRDEKESIYDEKESKDKELAA